MSSAATPPVDRDQHAPNPQGTRSDQTTSANRSVESRDLGKERRDLTARQKERFGGMKFGSGFFGWLTATGTAVLLTGLLTAAGAAIGSRPGAAASGAQAEPQTLGLVAGVTLLAVTLVAYFAGGYVAGRMARFNGLKQGFGVWLWALIATVVLTVLTLIAGAKFDVLSNVNALPPLPISTKTLTTASVILALGLVVIALVGALLGGLAGMRFHRRVDGSILDAGSMRGTTSSPTGR